MIGYVLHHMSCAVGIIIGRPSALERMDITADGFWKSFGAFIVALPVYLFIWMMNAGAARTADPSTSFAGVMTASIVSDIISWTLPVIVLALIMGPLGYKHRFPHLIIARNWSIALMAYLLSLAMVPLIFSPGLGLTTVISIVMLVAVVVAMVRVTRVALDSTYPIAIAFVIVESVVLYTLAGLAYSVFAGVSAS